jgi:class 3 adenylate cyclase
VNIASRIADLAQAGDVLTTEETMQQAKEVEVGWVRVGPTELQGVGKPVILYRAVTSTTNSS